jgi:predicted DCC family thiol-disulfide oxidoreductase YuxK
MMEDDTRVLYNETCPVCRFEIDAYARRAKADSLPIRFDGLAQANAWGLTPDQAARRLHVLHKGQLLSGIPAFQALWQELPHMRWLARITALPLIHPVTCLVYDRILAPVIYRAHLRRQRPSR